MECKNEQGTIEGEPFPKTLLVRLSQGAKASVLGKRAEYWCEGEEVCLFWFCSVV